MKITWDYVAGFIDGEGSFSATLRETGKRKLAICRLQVSQSSRDILLAIQDFTGCGGLYTEPEKKGKNWSAMWRLQFEGTEFRRVSLELIPRLFVKRTVSLLSWYFSFNRAGIRTPLTADDMFCIEIIKALNTRGIKDAEHISRLETVYKRSYRDLIEKAEIGFRLATDS